MYRNNKRANCRAEMRVKPKNSILRAIQKNYKLKVSGIFYKNPDLLYIWRVLSGSLFLNLCDENILNEIITFLNGCDFLIDDIYRAGFLEFKHYLIKYYLSRGSP